jgi:hypothetical protein
MQMNVHSIVRNKVIICFILRVVFSGIRDVGGKKVGKRRLDSMLKT